MIRLSACMITLNEEHNLSRALESVRGVADEIVIVDCGSRDRTPEIAREYGAKVITNAWTNFAQQKNSAAAAANNDWILSLDADEELSDELRGSLLAWKEGEPGCAVYEFARRAWYVGAWIKHSGWYPDRQRRLYRRDLARFSGIVHESLFLRTRGEGRAVHHACRAADVRCRETELARSAVAGDALELVQQLCAAPWVSRRLSRMGHLADGRAKYVAEVQKTGRAQGFRVA